jgi:hypothetical protein
VSNGDGMIDAAEAAMVEEPAVVAARGKGWPLAPEDWGYGIHDGRPLMPFAETVDMQGKVQPWCCICGHPVGKITVVAGKAVAPAWCVDCEIKREGAGEPRSKWRSLSLGRMVYGGRIGEPEEPAEVRAVAEGSGEFELLALMSLRRVMAGVGRDLTWLAENDERAMDLAAARRWLDFLSGEVAEFERIVRAL